MPCRSISAATRLLAIGLLALATAARADVVTTGKADTRLAPFDRLMTSFVAEHHVPGAALAVARDGRLVYARGFGFADRETREPVRPNALFRIASISKPFTAAAILTLVERGRFHLEDPALPLLGVSPPPNGPADPRLREITVRELLQHRGGWDRDRSFDPMFRPVIIARALGVPPPADARQVVRYMMTQPLDFDPDARYAYSNFGYCWLGRIIEHVSGEPYDDYVKSHVLAPLGIRDMRQGRTRRTAAGEVRYFAPGMTRSVFADDLGKPVPWPYGGWNLEAMDSHGGWIASAVDLVRFASSLDPNRRCPVLSAESLREMLRRPPGAAGFEPDGKPKAVWYGLGWMVRDVGRGRVNVWHNGLLSGTSTLLVRRFDGLTWAVLFNASEDPSGKNLAGLIDPLVHRAADQVRHWPDEDRFGEFLSR